MSPARYVPGESWLVVSARVMIMTSGSAEDSIDLLRLAAAGADTARLVQRRVGTALTGGDFAALGEFVIAAIEPEGLRVLVRSWPGVMVETAAGDLTPVASAGLLGWNEVLVPGGVAVRVGWSGDEGALDVPVGVVRAASVRWEATAVAALPAPMRLPQSHGAEPVEAAEHGVLEHGDGVPANDGVPASDGVPADHGVPVGDGAAAGGGPTPIGPALVVPALAVPTLAGRPGTEPDLRPPRSAPPHTLPSSGTTWTAPSAVVGGVLASGPQPVVPTVLGVPRVQSDPWAPESSPARHAADAEGDPSDTFGGDHDGLTQLAEDLPIGFTPAPLPAGPPPGVVLASLCPLGHANAPALRVCRICGRAIADGDPVAVPRPLLARIRLSTGDLVDLDRPVVIGRAPGASGFAQDGAPRLTPPGESPKLVSVPSPNHDVSRAHAQIRPEDWHLVVTDLESTNGTTIRAPGAAPRRLRPGQDAIVEPGWTVELGDGVSFAIEAVG